MNGLRRGNRSAIYNKLFETLAEAPVGQVARAANELLPPETRDHPRLAYLAWLFGAGEEPGPKASRLLNDLPIR